MPPTTRKAEEKEPEVVLSPWGNEADPYGRTNHAMTEGDVAQAAAAEGTLREDGRAKATVFYDDVLAQADQQARDFIEAKQHEKAMKKDEETK